MTFAGTGKLPFRGESLTAMAFAILHGEPSVGSLPEPLGSLVRRCLNKDPAVRPSARDALSELVAAGALPMGPLPPQPVTPATDDEESSPSAAPLEAPGPQRIAGASPKRGRAGDKPEHARGSSGRVRWSWRATALLASVLLIGGAGGAAPLPFPPRPPPRGGPPGAPPVSRPGAPARGPGKK